MAKQKTIDIDIITSNGTPIPRYATKGSACCDVYAAENATIRPGETFLMPTNMRTKIPEGYVALLFARSGLSTKKGISLANSVGVIDSDYTGEWKVALFNHKRGGLFNRKKNTVNIKRDERIAQFMVIPYPRMNFNSTIRLEETERGAGGFGSTSK